MRAAGVTVSKAEFELPNAMPCDVVPETFTWNTSGAATRIWAGMIKVTRRVDPMIVVTAVAFAMKGAPPKADVRLTSVFAGRMVPDGNPLPVTLMFVTPGSPDAGAGVGVSVTTTGACA